jgi:hypothetical protein
MPDVFFMVTLPVPGGFAGQGAVSSKTAQYASHSFDMRHLTGAHAALLHRSKPNLVQVIIRRTIYEQIQNHA